MLCAVGAVRRPARFRRGAVKSDFLAVIEEGVPP